MKQHETFASMSSETAKTASVTDSEKLKKFHIDDEVLIKEYQALFQRGKKRGKFSGKLFVTKNHLCW